MSYIDALYICLNYPNYHASIWYCWEQCDKLYLRDTRNA